MESRKIELRAWHIKRKEWHYFELPTEMFQRFGWTGSNCFELTGLDYKRWGQNTGFLDIDKNKIFEGDVVDWKDGRGVVRWDQEGGQWVHSYREKFNGRLSQYWRPPKKFWSIVKVIGNIHQDQRYRKQMGY